MLAFEEPVEEPIWTPAKSSLHLRIDKNGIDKNGSRGQQNLILSTLYHILYNITSQTNTCTGLQ